MDAHQPGDLREARTRSIDACSENNLDREHLGPGPGPIRPDGTRDYIVPELAKDPPPPEFYDAPAKPPGHR